MDQRNNAFKVHFDYLLVFLEKIFDTRKHLVLNSSIDCLSQQSDDGIARRLRLCSKWTGDVGDVGEA